MKNKIKCPHCGEEIEVTDALTHQIEERVLETLGNKHRQEIEDVKKETEENASKKAVEKFESEMKSLQKERDEEKERNKKLSEKLDELLDETRQLRRKDEERDLEMKKKLMNEEEKIREEATKTERERASLDIAEMRKKLADTEKALEDAKTKAKQGSQQLQGEVLELDLEEKLRSNFIYDEISAIGKGVQGADILQTVKNQNGKIAGAILWETKRAKWSPSWVAKLKEDGRKNDATMVVLVCENLPPDIDNFKVIDGVLITSRPFALSISAVLRRNLMLIAQAKSAAANKDEKLELLYNYLQSDAFRNRFESFSDGIRMMEEDLLTERRSMERIWKKREVQLERMRLNSSRMFGELQGVMGDKLPVIQSLELDSGEEMSD